MKLEYIIKLTDAYVNNFNRETILYDSLKEIGINVFIENDCYSKTIEEILSEECGEFFLDFLFAFIEKGYVTIESDDEEGMMDSLETVEDVVKAWMKDRNE